jgi:Zn-dependent protease
MLIISLLFLVIAITIHEFAHSFVADKLGDPTPRAYGRLSLNPLRHLDPLGILALIFFRIGWGKPVPVDSSNFRNPKRDEILVSISGPLSNFLLALLSSFALKYISGYTLIALLSSFIQLNIFLGIFNLLPIFPLDGSKIFLNLLPIEKSVLWQQDSEKYGYIIILLLFYTGLLLKIINFLANPILSLLL